MQNMSQEERTNEYVIKRVSVPVHLEELMNGLTKEILKNQPKDVILFASEYFAKLLKFRDDGYGEISRVRSKSTAIKLSSTSRSEKQINNARKSQIKSKNDTKLEGTTAPAKSLSRQMALHVTNVAVVSKKVDHKNVLDNHLKRKRHDHEHDMKEAGKTDVQENLSDKENIKGMKKKLSTRPVLKTKKISPRIVEQHSKGPEKNNDQSKMKIQLENVEGVSQKRQLIFKNSSLEGEEKFVKDGLLAVVSPRPKKIFNNEKNGTESNVSLMVPPSLITKGEAIKKSKAEDKVKKENAKIDRKDGENKTRTEEEVPFLERTITEDPKQEINEESYIVAKEVEIEDDLASSADLRKQGIRKEEIQNDLSEFKENETIEVQMPSKSFGLEEMGLEKLAENHKIESTDAHVVKADDSKDVGGSLSRQNNFGNIENGDMSEKDTNYVKDDTEKLNEHEVNIITKRSTDIRDNVKDEISEKKENQPVSVEEKDDKIFLHTKENDSEISHDIKAINEVHKLEFKDSDNNILSNTNENQSNEGSNICDEREFVRNHLESNEEHKITKRDIEKNISDDIKSENIQVISDEPHTLILNEVGGSQKNVDYMKLPEDTISEDKILHETVSEDSNKKDENHEKSVDVNNFPKSEIFLQPVKRKSVEESPCQKIFVAPLIDNEGENLKNEGTTNNLEKKIEKEDVVGDEIDIVLIDKGKDLENEKGDENGSENLIEKTRKKDITVEIGKDLKNTEKEVENDKIGKTLFVQQSETLQKDKNMKPFNEQTMKDNIRVEKIDTALENKGNGQENDKGENLSVQRSENIEEDKNTETLNEKTRKEESTEEIGEDLKNTEKEQDNIKGDANVSALLSETLQKDENMKPLNDKTRKEDKKVEKIDTALKNKENGQENEKGENLSVQRSENIEEDKNTETLNEKTRKEDITEEISEDLKNTEKEQDNIKGDANISASLSETLHKDENMKPLNEKARKEDKKVEKIDTALKNKGNSQENERNENLSVRRSGNIENDENTETLNEKTRKDDMTEEIDEDLKNTEKEQDNIKGDANISASLSETLHKDENMKPLNEKARKEDKKVEKIDTALEKIENGQENLTIQRSENIENDENTETLNEKTRKDDMTEEIDEDLKNTEKEQDNIKGDANISASLSETLHKDENMKPLNEKARKEDKKVEKIDTALKNKGNSQENEKDENLSVQRSENIKEDKNTETLNKKARKEDKKVEKIDTALENKVNDQENCKGDENISVHRSETLEKDKNMKPLTENNEKKAITEGKIETALINKEKKQGKSKEDENVSVQTSGNLEENENMKPLIEKNKKEDIKMEEIEKPVRFKETNKVNDRENENETVKRSKEVAKEEFMKTFNEKKSKDDITVKEIDTNLNDKRRELENNKKNENVPALLSENLEKEENMKSFREESKKEDIEEAEIENYLIDKENKIIINDRGDENQAVQGSDDLTKEENMKPLNEKSKREEMEEIVTALKDKGKELEISNSGITIIDNKTSLVNLKNINDNKFHEINDNAEIIAASEVGSLMPDASKVLAKNTSEKDAPSTVATDLIPNENKRHEITINNQVDSSDTDLSFNESKFENDALPESFYTGKETNNHLKTSTDYVQINKGLTSGVENYNRGDLIIEQEKNSDSSKQKEKDADDFIKNATGEITTSDGKIEESVLDKEQKEIQNINEKPKIRNETEESEIVYSAAQKKEDNLLSNKEVNDEEIKLKHTVENDYDSSELQNKRIINQKEKEIETTKKKEVKRETETNKGKSFEKTNVNQELRKENNFESEEINNTGIQETLATKEQNNKEEGMEITNEQDTNENKILENQIINSNIKQYSIEKSEKKDEKKENKIDNQRTDNSSKIKKVEEILSDVDLDAEKNYKTSKENKNDVKIFGEKLLEENLSTQELLEKNIPEEHKINAENIQEKPTTEQILKSNEVNETSGMKDKIDAEANCHDIQDYSKKADVKKEMLVVGKKDALFVSDSKQNDNKKVALLVEKVEKNKDVKEESNSQIKTTDNYKENLKSEELVGEITNEEVKQLLENNENKKQEAGYNLNKENKNKIISTKESSDNNEIVKGNSQTQMKVRNTESELSKKSDKEYEKVLHNDINKMHQELTLQKDSDHKKNKKFTDDLMVDTPKTEEMNQKKQKINENELEKVKNLKQDSEISEKNKREAIEADRTVEKTKLDSCFENSQKQTKELSKQPLISEDSTDEKILNVLVKDKTNPQILESDSKNEDNIKEDRVKRQVNLPDDSFENKTKQHFYFGKDSSKNEEIMLQKSLSETEKKSDNKTNVIALGVKTGNVENESKENNSRKGENKDENTIQTINKVVGNMEKPLQGKSKEENGHPHASDNFKVTNTEAKEIENHESTIDMKQNYYKSEKEYNVETTNTNNNKENNEKLLTYSLDDNRKSLPMKSNLKTEIKIKKALSVNEGNLNTEKINEESNKKRLSKSFSLNQRELYLENKEKILPDTKQENKSSKENNCKGPEGNLSHDQNLPVNLSDIDSPKKTQKNLQSHVDNNRKIINEIDDSISFPENVIPDEYVKNVLLTNINKSETIPSISNNDDIIESMNPELDGKKIIIGLEKFLETEKDYAASRDFFEIGKNNLKRKLDSDKRIEEDENHEDAKNNLPISPNQTNSVSNGDISTSDQVSSNLLTSQSIQDKNLKVVTGDGKSKSEDDSSVITDQNTDKSENGNDSSSSSGNNSILIRTEQLIESRVPITVQIPEDPGATAPVTSATSKVEVVAVSDVTESNSAYVEAPTQKRSGRRARGSPLGSASVASTVDVSLQEMDANSVGSAAKTRRNNASVASQDKNMEEVAATKIQASFRGYQVRKQLKTKNGGTESISQGRIGRRKNSGKIRPNDVTSASKNSQPKKTSDVEERSATKIQAGVRGFLTRRRFKKDKPDVTPGSS